VPGTPKSLDLFTAHKYSGSEYGLRAEMGYLQVVEESDLVEDYQSCLELCSPYNVVLFDQYGRSNKKCKCYHQTIDCLTSLGDQVDATAAARIPVLVTMVLAV
jgi:hypothetical protein